MLPYLTIYDHTNYARWVPVYLTEMKGLQTSAPDLHREFESGDFVIKRSKGRFNQVPADQATEWQNRTCKISNGIIGIMRNDTARDRFCITWAERSHASYQTRNLYGHEKDDDDEAISTCKDALPSRTACDNEAVEKLVDLSKRFDVFRINHARIVDDQPEETNPTDKFTPADGLENAISTDSHDVINNHQQVAVVDSDNYQSQPIELDVDDISTEDINIQSTGENVADDIREEDTDQEAEGEPRLISLATKDIATADIQKDLLTAKDKGIKLVCEYLQHSLIDQSVPFFGPLKRNKSRTFGTLYKTTITNKRNEKKTLKADRKLIQQLFNASRAARKIQMQGILTHELSTVPPSLAGPNGKMNQTTKADIITIVSAGMEAPPSVPDPSESQQTCISIDGHALIQSLGKPKNAKTFYDYAEVFFRSVTRHAKANVKRIDVVFDTYIKQSIKTTTREK